MNISIKPNTYKETKETDARESVVQQLCDLLVNAAAKYELYLNVAEKLYIYTSGQTGIPELKNKRTSCIDIQVRRCELELAIQLLRENGYHLFQYSQRPATRDVTLWKYKISVYPYPRPYMNMQNGKEVEKIADEHWSVNFDSMYY